MLTSRRLLTLSTSVALHLAAIGLGLLAGGAGAGSAILVDLADVAGERVHDAAPRPRAYSPHSGAGRQRASVPSAPLPRAPDRAPAASPPVASITMSEQEPITPATMAEPGVRPQAEPPVERPPIGAMADVPAAPAGGREGAKPRADETGGVAHGMSPAERAAPSASGSMRSGSTGPTAEAGRGSLAAGAGAPMALAPPGGALDAIPAEYGPYLGRFRRRVQESLGYPLAARRQGLSGTVEIEVLLEPSGRVSAVRLVASSSHAVLDDAALLAVKGLSPEPFPDLLPRRPLRIRLPLAFELR